MTLPARGIWKNSVLGNVLSERQVQRMPSKNKHVCVPIGQETPPARTHYNSHTPQPLPGMTKASRPTRR